MGSEGGAGQAEEGFDEIVVGVDDGIVDFGAGRAMSGGMQQESRAGIAAAVVFVQRIHHLPGGSEVAGAFFATDIA